MKFSKFTTMGAAAVLSMAVLAQGVLAVGPYDSEATVGFTEDTNALTLDSVSSLDFGNQIISMAEETYEAHSLEPSIEVTDKRATSDGWKVTLSATEFT